MTESIPRSGRRRWQRRPRRPRFGSRLSVRRIFSCALTIILAFVLLMIAVAVLEYVVERVGTYRACHEAGLRYSFDENLCLD